MQTKTHQLERTLGLWACIAIVIGSVIGSGIFMKPAIMAGQVGSPVTLLMVWFIAGVVSLFGGMINAEIGTILPKTGGQFVYFRYMYGEFFAFLYGWAAFIVINTASIAAISFVFAQYSEYFIHLPHFSTTIEKSIYLYIPGTGKLFLLENFGVKTVAITFIVLISFINYRSLKAGGAVQLLSTFLKIAALVFLVSVIFFSGNGSVKNFVSASEEGNASLIVIITGFIAATSGALMAFDGWNNLGMVAGEIKNPKKNIPKALIIGIAVCLLLYVLANQAFLYVLPIDQMKNSKLVATDALAIAVGAGSAGLIALMVMISTLGALNGNIMPNARITFAMGDHKVFSAWTSVVHPRFKTPGNAIWLQCIWSCMFVLTGSFNMLADMFVFVTWIFYGFAAYGIFVLRKKMPDAERTYKVWGYPVVPIVFVFFSVFYFVVTLYTDINNYIIGKTEFINSVYGLILTVAGIPVYFYYRKKYNYELKEEEE